MNAYVINLSHRKDRWASVLLQSELLPFEIHRFEATDSRDFGGSEISLLPAAVLACFDSHKRLLGEFLKTDENFALILEDDFTIGKSLKEFDFENLCSMGFDFIQIGFLRTTIFQHISIINRNFFDFLYKTGCCLISLPFTRLILRPFSSKILLKEQTGVSRRIVLHDVRPGTHAYIVSRKLATAIQKINSPAFLSADGLYIALGPLRTFKMGRLRKSLIGQSNSPSSIL